MSNVVSIARSSEYLVKRAVARRRKGNYDGAMTLLSKAKDQYGGLEEIEIELARTYDLMGCDEEAERAYLRVARMRGKHRAEALFNLALTAAQRADLPRAVSSYELFLQCEDQSVPPELVALLGDQLREEVERPIARSHKGRARALVRRAVERMQQGKTAAAKRSLTHALKLHSGAQAYTLLAYCELMEGHAQEAVDFAKKAHELAPSRVQTLCVLADAYALLGDANNARRTLYLAAIRAGESDDLLGVALESAKRGEDALTLQLTHKLLRIDREHTRAMMLRACALTNLGRLREASRLFGRLCVLLPENTVCEALYHMVREGEQPKERLTHGLDVPRKEGVSRSIELLTALYEDTQAYEPAQIRALCRNAAWAFRSALAGEQVAIVALLVLAKLDDPQASEVLLDGLTDRQISDDFKGRILQVLCQKEGMKPYMADIGGHLVHLAAGGSTQKTYADGLCRAVVQRAADALLPAFRDAPAILMELWIAYLEAYGPPRVADAAACAAALEYAYHQTCGRQVDVRAIARREFLSVRRCLYFARRIMRKAKKTETQEVRGEEQGGEQP